LSRWHLSDLRIDPDGKEAIAFACWPTNLEAPASNLPSATGARRAVILGKISPWGGETAVSISDLREKASPAAWSPKPSLGSHTCTDGVEIDYKEAFRLFSPPASKEGRSRAMANLAHMHMEGLCHTQERPEALRPLPCGRGSGEFLAQIELARSTVWSGVAPDPEARPEVVFGGTGPAGPCRRWRGDARGQAIRGSASQGQGLTAPRLPLR